MTLLFLLVILGLIASVVYFVAKAAEARNRKALNLWRPDINVLPSGDEEIVVFKPGRKPIVLAEISRDTPDLEAGVERDLAWEEAERKAKEWNR
jgi:hypothetical protein